MVSAKERILVRGVGRVREREERWRNVGVRGRLVCGYITEGERMMAILRWSSVNLQMDWVAVEN